MSKTFYAFHAMAARRRDGLLPEFLGARGGMAIGISGFQHVAVRRSVERKAG